MRVSTGMFKLSPYLLLYRCTAIGLSGTREAHIKNIIQNSVTPFSAGRGGGGRKVPAEVWSDFTI